MDNTYEEAYRGALANVEQSIAQALGAIKLPPAADMRNIGKSASTLDAWDYCYAIAIGMAGVFIHTNEALAKYLNRIIMAAGAAGSQVLMFQSFLGDRLFPGDALELLEGPLESIGEGSAFGVFNRLLWGGDGLSSVGQDGPFALMLEQRGMSGILGSVRRMLTDTAAKQELPVPTGSADENISTPDYLADVAQRLSQREVGQISGIQPPPPQMLTFSAQDVTAGVVVRLVSELYFSLRGIEDRIRKTEIRLIAYTVNFLAEAVIGCVRQNGVPYISIPLAGAMAVCFARLCYYNGEDIRRLTANTTALHAHTERLGRQTAQDKGLLQENRCSDDYIRAAERAERSAEELLDFFGEME